MAEPKKQTRRILWSVVADMWSRRAVVACRGQYFVKSAGCFGSIAPARLLFLWSGALAAAYGVFGLLLMADSGLWARKSYFAFVMADHGALGLYVVSRRFPLIPGVSCCFSGVTVNVADCCMPACCLALLWQIMLFFCFFFPACCLALLWRIMVLLRSAAWRY
jgi:hypothetical protein